MMVDPNDPAVQQAAAQDPGFFQRLMSNGVLGMNASEALLRFGSGLLSGDDWNQGLSRAASSLVQGGQQARAFQNQQAMAERRFQEARLLQNERLAAQERISGAGRQALTPYQRGGQVFRDRQTGSLYESVFDSRSGASTLVPVGGGDPLTGPALQEIQPRLDRASPEVVTGAQRLQEAAVNEWNAIRGSAQAAPGRVRDIDTILGLVFNRDEQGSLTTPRVATGRDLPSQAIRGVASALGINVAGTNGELLDILRVYLGQMNQEERVELLRGLQPVSNTEFRSAEDALPTLATNPYALRVLLEQQRSRAQNAQALFEHLQPNAQQLIQNGTLPDAVVQWRIANSGSGPRVTHNGADAPPRTTSTTPQGQQQQQQGAPAPAPSATPRGTYRPGEPVVLTPSPTQSPAPAQAAPARPQGPSQAARDNALIRQRQLEQSPEYQRATEPERLAMRRALARELATEQGR